MKYFGEPQCPYCGKRVNLIRTWSLKRQGEYCCTHCGGYSNVHHLPILYVLALVCALVSVAVYVFQRYIFQTVELKTALYVFLPFAVFFLGSLFFVQLRKPEVKVKERDNVFAIRAAKKKMKQKQKTGLFSSLFKEEEPAAPVSGRTKTIPQQNVKFVQSRPPVQNLSGTQSIPSVRVPSPAPNKPLREYSTRELLAVDTEDTENPNK